MKALMYRKLLDDKLIIFKSVPFLLMILNYIMGEDLWWEVWLVSVIAGQLIVEPPYYRTLNFNKREYFQAGIFYATIKFIFRLIVIILINIVFNKKSLSFLNILFPLYAYFLIEILSGVSSYRFSNKVYDEKKITIAGMILLGGILLGLYTVRFQFSVPIEKVFYGGLYLTFVAIIFLTYFILNYQGVDSVMKDNQSKKKGDARW